MPSKNRVALIVDDDPSLRYVLARLAQQADHEVIEARDAADALAAATTQGPDVVVADVRLPGDDGFELCRQLKAGKKTNKIPVILVTSMYYQSKDGQQDLTDGRKQAKKAGAINLFPRGEALDELGPLLERLAKGRR